MSYDPVIPLLDMYLDKIIIQKDTCTPMVIAALFTIAKTWTQSKCPTTDEWIKKMWCVHTHTHTHTHNELPFSNKKERNNVICSNMDTPRDDHTN